MRSTLIMSLGRSKSTYLYTSIIDGQHLREDQCMFEPTTNINPITYSTKKLTKYIFDKKLKVTDTIEYMKSLTKLHANVIIIKRCFIDWFVSDRLAAHTGKYYGEDYDARISVSLEQIHRAYKIWDRFNLYTRDIIKDLQSCKLMDFDYIMTQEFIEEILSTYNIQCGSSPLIKQKQNDNSHYIINYNTLITTYNQLSST